MKTVAGVSGAPKRNISGLIQWMAVAQTEWRGDIYEREGGGRGSGTGEWAISIGGGHHRYIPGQRKRRGRTCKVRQPQGWKSKFFVVEPS